MDESAGRRPLLGLRPRPLALAIGLGVIILMAGLGLFIIERYRALQLHSYGEIGSVYVDHLLAPYTLAQLEGGEAPAPSPGGLLRDFDGMPLRNGPMVLRVWLPEGTLLYTSLAQDSDELHDPSDLQLAIGGVAVSRLEVAGEDGGPGSPIAYPYFEIYAPIHDPVSGRLVAVGEIYQDATEILRDRAFVERAVWTAIAAATTGVLVMLALSARQSDQLAEHLRAERRMAAQNDQLRREAEQARRDAAQANEEVLNLVGAELHDGPVQLLGLMSLMGDDGRRKLPDGTSFSRLSGEVLQQLRTIAAGLILPELETLDAGAVATLAVERHRTLTGGAAGLDLSVGDLDLDLPRKVCLYRVVQEGLANAARHGEGDPPLVRVWAGEGALEVAIRSDGSKPAAAAEAPPMSGLGLQAMRRRLEAFGGGLRLERQGAGTLLSVTLPLRPAAPPPVS